MQPSLRSLIPFKVWVITVFTFDKSCASKHASTTTPCPALTDTTAPVPKPCSPAQHALASADRPCCCKRASQQPAPVQLQGAHGLTKPNCILHHVYWSDDQDDRCFTWPCELQPVFVVLVTQPLLPWLCCKHAHGLCSHTHSVAAQPVSMHMHNLLGLSHAPRPNCPAPPGHTCCGCACSQSAQASSSSGSLKVRGTTVKASSGPYVLSRVRTRLVLRLIHRQPGTMLTIW